MLVNFLSPKKAHTAYKKVNSAQFGRLKIGLFTAYWRQKMPSSSPPTPNLLPSPHPILTPSLSPNSLSPFKRPPPYLPPSGEQTSFSCRFQKGGLSPQESISTFKTLPKKSIFCIIFYIQGQKLEADFPRKLANPYRPPAHLPILPPPLAT